MQRRSPNQERSRQLVQKIMTSAMELVLERQSIDVSMREISQNAGIAPSSVYQYFSNKTELFFAIIEEYYSETRKILSTAPTQVKDVQQTLIAVDSCIDALYRMYYQEPALLIIVGQIQSIPEWRSLDLSSSHENAKLIATKICQLFPGQDYQAIEIACEQYTHQLGNGVRFVFHYEDEEKQLESLNALKMMCRNNILLLIGARKSNE